MVEACSCGCGPKVPLDQYGAAELAASVTGWVRLLSKLDPAMLPPEARSDFARFLLGGHELAKHLLDHVNKTARAGFTPDLMRLNLKCKAFSEAAANVVGV